VFSTAALVRECALGLAVNDIRNLMDNLHTQLEYKEFDTAMRAPTDSWPVLDRLHRAATPSEAPTSTAAAEPATAPRRAPAVAAEAAPHAGRSLLGRYAGAAEPAYLTPETARQMPLADVFARLELAGR
jgi:hypothetical protein